MVPPRIKDYIENPNIRHKSPSFELLVRVVQKTPKTTQAVAITLGCPPPGGVR